MSIYAVRLTTAVCVLSFLSCSSSDDAAADADQTPAVVPSDAVVDTIAQRAEEVGVELVGEGVVSTNRNETFPAEDPVDGSLWFSTYANNFAQQTIMVAHKNGSGWAEPEVASFSGTHGDRAPRFSLDGEVLYFTSNRPRTPDAAGDDMNIWRVRRSGDGWSDPELMGGDLNSDAQDIHAAPTNTAVWLASNRPSSLGRSDIYRVALGGDTPGVVTHLPAPVNDENSQPDIWVSPDESWMILAITDHPSGFGGDDLYISRFENGSWSTPTNLGAGINSSEYEYGPTMSADGQYILFTSHRTGTADVYRVPVAAVEGAS